MNHQSLCAIKVRVQIREKTPPPDTSKMVPKNVVPIEEQVNHLVFYLLEFFTTQFL